MTTVVPEGVTLTPKQQQVLDLMNQGMSQSQIAKQMGVSSPSAVSGHVAALREKGVLPKKPNGSGPKTAAKAAVKRVSRSQGSGAAIAKPQGTASTNGTDPSGAFALDAEVGDALGQQIEVLKSTVTTIERTTEIHTARIVAIDSEAAALAAERKAHEVSIQALDSRKADTMKAVTILNQGVAA